MALSRPRSAWFWLLAALLAYVALAQGLGLYVWFGAMGQASDWLPVLQAADGMVALVALVALLRGTGRPSLPVVAALLQGVTVTATQVWMVRMLAGFDAAAGGGQDLAALAAAYRTRFWSARHAVEFGAQWLAVAAMLLAARRLKQAATSGPGPAH